MQHHTAEEKANQTHARSLLADIHGAPAAFIPRREIIVGWLDAFLLRADRRNYVVEPTESEDLVALDSFLRGQDVPVAVAPAV